MIIAEAKLPALRHTAPVTLLLRKSTAATQKHPHRRHVCILLSLLLLRDKVAQRYYAVNSLMGCVVRDGQQTAAGWGCTVAPDDS
jgi:hypothetical protein